MDFEIIFFAIAIFITGCILLVFNKKLSQPFCENEMSFVKKFLVLNPRETVLAVGAGGVIFGILIFFSQIFK